MLRSAIVCEISIDLGLLGTEEAPMLFALHQRQQSQLRFEDWLLKERVLSSDSAQQLKSEFGVTQLICMDCMAVAHANALPGDADLRCANCGSSALKRSATPARSTSSSTIAPPPSAVTTSVARRSTRKIRAHSDSGVTTKPNAKRKSMSAAPAPVSDRLELESQPGWSRKSKIVELHVSMSGARPVLSHESGVQKTTGAPTERAIGRIGGWDVLRIAGEGGMGKVFKCYHAILGRYAAVKVLEHFKDSALKRFCREARTLALLDHPGIVRLYEFGEHKGNPYFAMEWVEGRTLAQLVKQSGPVPPLQTIDIGIQACAALALAHEMDVVHRDIKPDNIMLDRNGCVKISDFGIATEEAGSNRLTAPGTIVGTAAYMSPEQIQQDVGTPRTDIYSLSAVLYFLLTGKEPFVGNDAKVMLLHTTAPFPALDPALRAATAGLEDLLQHMSAKKPADRPDSMLDVAKALHVIRRSLDAELSKHEKLNVIGHLGVAEGVDILNSISMWSTSGIREIILDLRECTFVSGSTLERLGVFADSFSKVGGRLIFVNVPTSAEFVVRMAATKHKIQISADAKSARN